jgi:3-hydroxyisobutyrate dehydrogenase-like beta-hydroxyacid dehydrogenase
MKVGFIGLGIMGSRMAANLIRAGYTLHLFNRTAVKAQSLVSEKSSFESSPAVLAIKSDVIITMVSTPEAVQELALGEGGFLHSMKKGSVWMNCSTVNPSFSNQMAEITEKLGFNFLDAPVAGSLAPAESGELVFLVGGKKSIINYCKPLFGAMGKKVIHVGGHGKGSSMKLVNNLVMGIAMYGFMEGLLLGESLGLQKEQIFDLLEGSPVAPPMVGLKRGKMTDGNFSPEFPLQWLQKDLHLAAQTAYEHGIALPGTNVIKEIFALARKAGLGEKDFTAVYPYISGKPA